MSGPLAVTNVHGMPDAFSAAAEPTRRRILQLLASGPRSAGELASHFTATRSAVSQHLGVLLEVGLVTNHREGRSSIYRLDPAAVAALRAEIDRFWTDELELLVADAQELAAHRGRAES